MADVFTEALCVWPLLPLTLTTLCAKKEKKEIDINMCVCVLSSVDVSNSKAYVLWILLLNCHPVK